MCLYPKLIVNKKYLPTKKNNYNPPTPKDGRTKYVPIGCGQCIECRQQKAREWQVRLTEELKVNKAYFVTLSFSCEELEKLANETGSKTNIAATLAIRRFLERFRKKYKTSVKHWLITELGHTNTERIHLHGILFTNNKIDKETLQSIWKYGNIYIGDYCNEQTINYVVKYVTKIDTDHKDYKQVIFASAGLGKNYINKNNVLMHKYKPKETKDYYTLSNGQKINLPIYYRNKLFTEEEREQLWLERLDKAERYVRGIRIENTDTAEGWKKYERIRDEAQKENTALGYGDDSKTWKAKDYNITARMLNKQKKVEEYIKIRHFEEKTEKKINNLQSRVYKITKKHTFL